jgi:hypothetical protein
MPLVQALGPDTVDALLDKFEPRQELRQGAVLLREGAPIDRLYVVRSGDVALTRGGAPVPLDGNFVQEAGGFLYFGAGCIDGSTFAPPESPYTVMAASLSLVLITLTVRRFESVLQPGARRGSQGSVGSAASGERRVPGERQHVEFSEVRPRARMARPRPPPPTASAAPRTCPLRTLTRPRRSLSSRLFLTLGSPLNPCHTHTNP